VPFELCGLTSSPEPLGRDPFRPQVLEAWAWGPNRVDGNHSVFTSDNLGFKSARSHLQNPIAPIFKPQRFTYTREQ
jgi:hypothetical protein